MKKNVIFFVLLLIVLLPIHSQAQLKVKEALRESINSKDSLFFNIYKPNKVVNLNDNWDVYIDKDNAKVSGIKVPAIFDGEDYLYFERYFSLSKDDIDNYNIRLCFDGINHNAEIYINNVLVSKTIGGDYSFFIDIAKDVLKYSSQNKLTVKVYNQLDAENTIPVKNRFLFPIQLGGITKNVYLKLTSMVNIAAVKTEYTLTNDLGRAKVKFTIDVDKRRLKDKNRNYKQIYPNPFTYEITITNINDNTQAANYRSSFNLSNNDVTKSEVFIETGNIKLWNFNSPENYVYDIKLYYGDNLLDRYKGIISFYKLEINENKITINNIEHSLRGTTYYLNSFSKDNLISYYGIERDLKIIKDMGFNTVRFARAIPNPYALYMCERLGLLAFIELPLNSIPNKLYTEPNFISFSEENLNLLINKFSSYSAVAAIGVGGSYLANNDVNNNFISHLASLVKSKTLKYSYASFVGFPTSKIENLDLYGIELYSKNISEVNENFTESVKTMGNNKVFYSEVTYPSFVGSSNGYLTPFSEEAQANFYQELLDFAKNNNIKNLFINSAFDYKGATAGFYAGYDKNNIYKVGIVGIDRNINRLSFKVIKSKLTDAEKVTIPIGKKLDDTPFFFILSAILIAVIMALIINARRKFREDATRALIRPYNFFADIRDQRLLSGWHASILLVILSATHSLLLTNLLYSLRGNILLEKIINSLGIDKLTKLTAYLAWNPVAGFIYLFFFSMFLFLAITVLIKWSAFFVKIKVFFQNVYYMVMWALLPLVLMLPVELVLYKVISLNIGNIYIYIILVFFAFWLIQRLIKGIYVIFDANPVKVYFFSFFVIFVILGLVLTYLQVNYLAFDYIKLSLSQFALL